VWGGGCQEDEKASWGEGKTLPAAGTYFRAGGGDSSDDRNQVTHQNQNPVSACKAGGVKEKKNLQEGVNIERAVKNSFGGVGLIERECD